MTDTGGIGWTSPSGRYYPPPPDETQPPDYPDWLKNLITEQRHANQRLNDEQHAQERQAELDAQEAQDRLRNQPPPF